MSTFQRNLVYKREQKKLSQEKMAKVFLIPRSTYASYEEGRSEPRYKLLVNICKHHRISIDKMLTIDLLKNVSVK